jgi:hypothetical protein
VPRLQAPQSPGEPASSGCSGHGNEARSRQE